MKKHSVVFKLFIVTTALILIVFSLVLFAEGFFFERFYRSTKIHEIEHAMAQFTEQFNKDGLNEQQVSRRLASFMNQNDASISVLNDRFERTASNPYFLDLQADNKTISISIPKEGMEMDAIPQKIKIGDVLVIDGIFMDEKDTIMQPVAIKHDNLSRLQEGLVRVKGKVADFVLPEQRSYNPLYQDALIEDALREWKPKAEDESRLQKGSVVQLEWQDKWSGVDYAVLISSLAKGEDGNRYIFVMTSLQPVGEAVGVLEQYFVYMAPIIVVLVIMLSMIYSRIVSRPLVMLSRSAERLAKLDFTEQTELHSKDEFGELSRNMNALSRNLDAALNELTHANKKLQEEMEEKQRAEQLRKELIANISHELKTPLGIVKGFAEGLQDGVASEKRERYLGLIVNETNRMNALIMDMLELSKFKAKAIRLQTRSISLTALIQKVAESFSHQLDSKYLQIRLDTAADEQLLVEADSRRIEQVVLNLLSNAIRHAVENSVITISIKRTTAGKVTTTIENVGPAIAEPDLSRIWEQFYRAEHSRDRKSGGTGLGLAIVKHILELHQSRYDVVNTDHGVAFSFTLNESRGELIE
ncbi:sensor histidine kinase [Psychrobacillus sp. NPDC096623]|uniref:sensor histidine kinase n=1 Tax=Psychrobacillus sp. NPDC096623 TaxID=3364492 RepID=UPI0037FFD413